jgi:CPA2 family monovalent cation:H+ antiporter-2
MTHQTTLIATIVGGIVLAFVFGAIASRLRLSPLVGYLLAGIVAGPYTPGFIADQELVPVLAEIGVILLMFGVGLHFSLRDLLSVRRIAVPGAIVQIAVATTLGAAFGVFMGWPLAAGLVYGLSLSVASTVVLLRAFEGNRLLETERGRIAVGWLVVEDLVMVLVLVLVPSLATSGPGSAGSLAGELAITLGKVAAFVAVMLLVGRRLIPFMLRRIALGGSRELFTLAVLSIALGVAFGSAALFGVSFALGAFFAGVLLNGSEFSHEAASDSLPLRDAFSVLFFVSVGMLVDPGIVLRAPLEVLATLLVIVVGKSLAALVIVRTLGHPRLTATTVAISLAQIGEFSFILIGLAADLDIVDAHVRDLVLAGALLSIMLNPLLFVLLDRHERRRQRASERHFTGESLHGHVVLVGFGRVGSLIGAELARQSRPVVVLETQDDPAERAGALGLPVLLGDASSPQLLEAAGIHRATNLVVAISSALLAGKVVAVARAVNPRVHISASAYSAIEETHLRQRGAHEVIVGSREIARAITRLCARLDPPAGTLPP